MKAEYYKKAGCIFDATGKKVAPCASPEDADFIALQEWLAEGNIPETYPEKEVVNSLSRAEVKLRLAERGLYEVVKNAINQLPETNRLRIRYEDALYFERTDTDLIVFCRDFLGWTENQIDDFFTG